MAEGRVTRRGMLGSAAIAGAAVFASCDAGEPAGAPKAGLLAPATLTYANWFAAGNAQDVLFQYQGALFKDRHPQLTVEQVKRGPGVSMLEMFLSMAAAGTAPDLAALNPQFVEPLRARGLLADLTGYVKRDARTFRPDDFYEATRLRAIRNGRWHAIPLQMGLWFTVYNRALIQQGGQREPDSSWTWEDALEIARAVKSREPGVLGIAFPPYELPVRGNGGEILSKDEKKCLLGEPPATEAVQWIANLRVKHQVVPQPQETAGLNAQTLFTSGRYLFHIGDPGFLSSVQRAAPVFDWDIAVPPRGRSAQVSTVKGPSLVVSSATPHEEAAWAWLSDYTGVEMQRYVSVEGKIVSARKSALAAFVALDEGFDKRVLLAAAAMARPMPYVAKYDEIDKEIDAGLDAVYNGRAPAATAMREAARKVDLVLGSA
ncbi:MAG TPA: sugar ABC transporter substrate-binding protein [Chloroflexota bacterium]|nr:sugar ABC transporter substrate-binding protein [Chloroflexota bacterium]